jgi:phenylalanyl-tRNA synthetase beta chain
MPTVTLNKTEFEELVGKKLPLEELKDRISMLGTDLEKIEGNEIIVEVFPNRPDMLSEQGLARAFSSFIGVKTGLRRYKIKKSGNKVFVDKSVSMRPYTVCALVKNIEFDDKRIRSIMQTQEKLALSHGRNRKKSEYGIYPSPRIEFPIKYIAKKPEEIKFIPLGFKTVMDVKEIEEMHPTGREYKNVAEGWKKYPIFIDNKDNILSLLPYTNSEDTGKIDEDTIEVFVECTGNNLENVKKALNIFVSDLADMGGEIYSIDVVYPDKTITTPDLNPEEMEFDLGYCNKTLGLELKENEVKTLLERMGYEYAKGKVLIPSYRADILHQIDLVEDVAIAYGYENFKEEIPNVSTVGKESERSKLRRKISEVLIGLGLLECNSLSLSNEEDLNGKMLVNERVVKVESPVNQDYDTLRTRVVPSLLKVLSENKRHEYPQNIFEIGKVFEDVKDKDALGIVVNGNFTELKQKLEALFSAMAMGFEVKESEEKSFISGRCGKVMVGDKELGIIGELSPGVLSNFGLEMAFSGLELDVEGLFELM